MPENDDVEPFDEDAHNQLIAIMHNMNNFYETGDKTNGFH